MNVIDDAFLLMVPPEETVAGHLGWLRLDWLDYEVSETRLAWLIAQSFLRPPWATFWAWLRGTAP